MYRLILIVLLAGILFDFSFAQSARKINREGNEYYKNGEYEKAERNYEKAFAQNKNLIEASYNLALSYYRQEKYNEAITQSKKTLSRTSDKELLSKLYHNLGNSYLKVNKLKESIDSYQNSLRINPGDKETRYNLTYAMLKYKASQKEQNTKDLLDRIEQEEKFSQQFRRRNKNRGKEVKNW